MGDFEPADVFIAGYPKSGNTWMQLLVSGIIYGLDPGTTPDTLIQELVPDVHYKRLYKRFLPGMPFKTHHLPRPEYRRVINIVRDGRDVLCSYHHYRKALGMPFDMDDAIDGAEISPFGKWEHHVDAWLRNPYAAEMLIVRYEDLIDNCTRELARIAGFLGVVREMNDLSKLAAATEIQRMKHREAKFGWDNKAWPSSKPFVRRGQKNCHVTELTADQVRRFESRAARSLESLGYAVQSSVRMAA